MADIAPTTARDWMRSEDDDNRDFINILPRKKNLLGPTSLSSILSGAEHNNNNNNNNRLLLLRI